MRPLVKHDESLKLHDLELKSLHVRPSLSRVYD